MMKSFFTLILLLTLMGCDQMESQKKSTHEETNKSEKQLLMDFEMIDLSGSIRNSSEWNNSAKLINFWATWCAPCRREIPLLNETQKNLTGTQIQIIGIAVDDFDEVLSYAETTNFDYPILIGEEDAVAIAENSGVDFIGLPFTMIVTKDQEIIKTHIGEIKEHHIELITQTLKAIENGEMTVSEAKMQLGSI
ncbi:MAG: thiol-disulfide isomerase/thioredoxin [Woeseiaceae bacterium]|jgi:thiol-disulfide isomerase/thioredoxin|tara:strand:+ start:2459 stop:3037 length:579 start_codon:yes stop_codon:yes gene_type:complete